MTLQVRIILLLLNAFSDGLLIPKREVTGGGFALFLGFGAFQGDEFLHDVKRIEGSEQRAPPARRNLNLRAAIAADVGGDDAGDRGA